MCLHHSAFLYDPLTHELLRMCKQRLNLAAEATVKANWPKLVKMVQHIQLRTEAGKEPVVTPEHVMTMLHELDHWTEEYFNCTTSRRFVCTWQ